MASGAAAAIAQAVARPGASTAAVGALARTLRAERAAAVAALEGGAAWALWNYLAEAGDAQAGEGEGAAESTPDLPAAGQALLGVAQIYGAETAWCTACAQQSLGGEPKDSAARPDGESELAVTEPGTATKLSGLTRLLGKEPGVGCELVEALVQQAEPSGRAEIGAYLMQDEKLMDVLVAGLPHVTMGQEGSEGEAEADSGEGGGSEAKVNGAAFARALAALFKGVRNNEPSAKSLLERGAILKLKRAMLAGPKKSRVAAAYLLESLCEASLECTRSTFEHGGLDSMKALLPKPAWEPPPVQGDEGGQERAIDQEIDIDDTLLGDMLLDEEEMIAQGEEKEAEDQAAAEAAAKAEEVRKQNALPAVEKESDDPQILSAVLGVLRASTSHATVRRDVYADSQIIPPHVIYLHCIYGGGSTASNKDKGSAGAGTATGDSAGGEGDQNSQESETSGGEAATGGEAEDGQEGAEDAKPGSEKGDVADETPEAGRTAQRLHNSPEVQEAALAALKPLLLEPEIAEQIGLGTLFTEWLQSDSLPECSSALQQQLLELLPQLRSESNERSMGKAITAFGPQVANGHKVLQTYASWAMFCLPESNFHAPNRPPPESPPPSPPPPPLATSKFLWDALGRPEMIDGVDLGEPQPPSAAGSAAPASGEPVPAQ